MSIKPNFDSYEENFKKYHSEVSGFTFNDEIKINFRQRDIHTEVVTVPQDLLRTSRELFTGEQLVYDARDLYSTPFVEISQGFTANGTSQGEWEDLKDPQLRNLNYVSDKVGMFKQPTVMEIDKNVILAKNLPNAVNSNSNSILKSFLILFYYQLFSILATKIRTFQHDSCGQNPQASGAITFCKDIF